MVLNRTVWGATNDKPEFLMFFRFGRPNPGSVLKG